MLWCKTRQLVTHGSNCSKCHESLGGPGCRSGCGWRPAPVPPRVDGGGGGRRPSSRERRRPRIVTEVGARGRRRGLLDARDVGATARQASDTSKSPDDEEPTSAPAPTRPWARQPRRRRRHRHRQPVAGRPAHEVETREIPYETRIVRDPALPARRQEGRGPRRPRRRDPPLPGNAHRRPADRPQADRRRRRPASRSIRSSPSAPRPRPAPVGRCATAARPSTSASRSAARRSARRRPRGGRLDPLPDLVVSSDDLGYLEGLAC
jgi:hypothetical protein